MNEHLALELIVEPTLTWLDREFKIPNTLIAEQMLLTIGLQESAFLHRAQVVNSGMKGPARGWWQFERAGGVAGVLRHSSSKATAEAVCKALAVPAVPADVHVALETCDLLACVFARLLLLTDPKPLPETSQAGWDYYIRNWRPGKPHPDKWPRYWKRAEAAIKD